MASTPNKFKVFKDSRLLTLLFSLTITVIVTLFIWEGNIGFSLWDEGFLWYGVQRVTHGEVPIRDFMSYDPGRYYWSAVLMSLWNESGIMALRVTVVIFQAIGLFTGLLLIAHTIKKQNALYLLLSAITLAMWMFPRHKLFDITLSILSIAILAFLVKNPTNRRYFFSGIGVGLLAVFGRNHGVYAVIAGLGVIIWLNINRTEGPKFIKGLLLWTVGIVIGFSPIILMILLVPGFAPAFWESIRFLFENKATNLPLSIPWPWLVNVNSVTLGEAVRQILIGLFFIMTIMFGIIYIMLMTWQKLKQKQVSPVLIAASFLTIPYSHYAFSRADINHLAQGIFPLLIGCLALISVLKPKLKLPLIIIFFSANLWVSHVFHPGWKCHLSKQCIDTHVSSDILEVNPHTANVIRLLENLSAQYTPNDQSFIVTPFWPGAYALLNRKSPMWEIYALFPRSKIFEQAEIERIKKASPRFIFILDLPLDNRNELRFKNTHPLTYKYILDNFELLPNSHSSTYQIYIPKGTS